MYECVCDWCVDVMNMMDVRVDVMDGCVMMMMMCVYVV